MNQMFFKRFTLLFATVLLFCWPLGCMFAANAAFGLGLTGPTTVGDTLPAPPTPDTTSQDTYAPTAGNPDIPAQDVNTVHNAQELADWLNAHTMSSTPVTVTLANDITVSQGLLVMNYAAPITIDTGVYSLVFDGAYYMFMGDVLITGAGVAEPVVEAKNLGYLRFGDWSNYLRLYNITATGVNGVGGVALRIAGADSGKPDLTELSAEPPGLLQSFGAGAIGMEVTNPTGFNAYCFNIAAEGNGSTAVSAPSGALLSFCKLTATGAGADTVRGDDITLDTCLTTPAVTGGAGISAYNRVIAPAYIPLPQGSSFNDLWDAVLMQPYALLTGGDGRSDLTGLIPDWDEDALYNIDLDSLGQTEVSGSFIINNWFDAFFPPDKLPTIIVDVRDPNAPTISMVNIGTDTIELRLWATKAWTTDNCILWRSDDGGQTWYDCTNDPGVVWNNGNKARTAKSVQFPSSVITEGCLYQVEAPGFGESNIVRFSFIDGQPTGGQGGDRTGVDRVIGQHPGSGNGGNTGDNTGGSDGTSGSNTGDKNTGGSDNNSGDGDNQGGSNGTPGTGDGDNTGSSDKNGDNRSDNSSAGNSDSTPSQDNTTHGSAGSGSSGGPSSTPSNNGGSLPADNAPMDAGTNNQSNQPENPAGNAENINSTPIFYLTNEQTTAGENSGPNPGSSKPNGGESQPQATASPAHFAAANPDAGTKQAVADSATLLTKPDTNQANPAQTAQAAKPPVTEQTVRPPLPEPGLNINLIFGAAACAALLCLGGLFWLKFKR